MRGRRLKRRAIFGSLLALAVVIVAVTMLMPVSGENEARTLPAPALNTIAQKNDNAAITAAAAMRQRSAHTARIADALQDQHDRENNAAQ
jgi:hypothetical protein